MTYNFPTFTGFLPFMKFVGIFPYFLFSASWSIRHQSLGRPTLNGSWWAKVWTSIGYGFLHCFSTVSRPMEFPECWAAGHSLSACCCTINPECHGLGWADGSRHHRAVHQGGGQPLSGGVKGAGTSLSNLKSKVLSPTKKIITIKMVLWVLSPVKMTNHVFQIIWIASRLF